MPKPNKPGSPWYDQLSLEEAKEVATLDASLESLDAARAVLVARRDTIRTRAQMRLRHRRTMLSRVTEGLPEAIVREVLPLPDPDKG